MERKPFFVAKDCNSIGIDKVPPKAMMLNKTTGAISLLKNKTGVVSNTRLKDSPIFFSYQPASFDSSCPEVPPFSFEVTTEIFILYDFPHAVLPDYPLETRTNGGITGYVIYGTDLIVYPGNPYKGVRSNGSIYDVSSPYVSGVIANIYPDGTFQEITGGIDNVKQVLLDDIAKHYIGKTWDRTTIN